MQFWQPDAAWRRGLNAGGKGAAGKNEQRYRARLGIRPATIARKEPDSMRICQLSDIAGGKANPKWAVVAERSTAGGPSETRSPDRRNY